MSVTNITSFLFLDGIEPFLGHEFSVTKTTIRCSSIFSLGAHNTQNLLPQICTKSPISRLVCQIDRRCLGLLWGFRGWPIQWIHAKCCGADPCCHGNDIWARSGDSVAYRLVYLCVYRLGLYQILALAYPESGHFSEIWLQPNL